MIKIPVEDTKKIELCPKEILKIVRYNIIKLTYVLIVKTQKGIYSFYNMFLKKTNQFNML